MGRLRLQLFNKLDSTARQHLKSPRSLSGRSLHPILVTKGHGHGHEWPNPTHFDLPFWDSAISKFDHENPWSTPYVWSRVKVTFDLENPKVKVMSKVKPIGHIWGLEFNRYACVLYHGNPTFFGWDIANSIRDLKNSRSRLWPRSNLMVTFEA